MSAAVWTQQKVKISYGRRKSSVNALVSASAPGIGLQEGEWVDFENAKGKMQLEPTVFWRPFVLATGAACGPVMEDLDKASEYATAVAQLRDWTTGPNEVAPPIYAKVMRLWYAAAGKALTAEQEAKLTQLEAMASKVSNA